MRPQHHLSHRWSPSPGCAFEDVGEILARDPQRLAGYIFVGLPIAGTDHNDYLVRNLIGLDPNSRRIAVGEYVNPGQPLLFCRRDGNSAREDMRRMLRDIQRRLPAPAREEFISPAWAGVDICSATIPRNCE